MELTNVSDVALSSFLYGNVFFVQTDPLSILFVLWPAGQSSEGNPWKRCCYWTLSSRRLAWGLQSIPTMFVHSFIHHCPDRKKKLSHEKFTSLSPMKANCGRVALPSLLKISSCLQLLFFLLLFFWGGYRDLRRERLYSCYGIFNLWKSGYRPFDAPQELDTESTIPAKA